MGWGVSVVVYSSALFAVSACPPFDPMGSPLVVVVVVFAPTISVVVVVAVVADFAAEVSAVACFAEPMTSLPTVPWIHHH